jgi:hypothetical protein
VFIRQRVFFLVIYVDLCTLVGKRVAIASGVGLADVCECLTSPFFTKWFVALKASGALNRLVFLFFVA